MKRVYALVVLFCCVLFCFNVYAEQPDEREKAKEISLPGFDGDAFHYININEDESIEIEEGNLILSFDGKLKIVNLDTNTDDIISGDYSIAGIKVGDSLRDTMAVIEYGKDDAFFKNASGKTGPFEEEVPADYFPSEWVSLFLMWYRDLSGDWHRMEVTDMAKAVWGIKPSTGCDLMYTLSFDVNEESKIEAIYAIYAPFEKAMQL